MTDKEAQEVIRMVESNWSFDLQQEGRALWRAELVKYDAEVGVRAVSRLARESKFKPTLADIREYLRLFQREADDIRRAQDMLDRSEATASDEESRYGGPPPEWVSVWMWARWGRDPALAAFLPQQESGLTREQRDPEHYQYEPILSMIEYEALREEWVAAGSPKGKFPGVVTSDV